MAMAASFSAGYAPPTFNPIPGTHLAPFALHFHPHPRRAAAAALRDVCAGRVPDHVLQRVQEVGYVVLTEVQERSLPLLLTDQECILHAQAPGRRWSISYLYSPPSTSTDPQCKHWLSSPLPTRELGIQVTKVARLLAAKACTVMALLDGGMLKRKKSWVKAEPPAMIVATVPSLCQMVERHAFSLQSVRVLVIDEVDFIFGSSKQICTKTERLHVLLSLLERAYLLLNSLRDQRRLETHLQPPLLSNS
ncbi:unnamed protein product [Urochloa humidicola]